MPCSLHVGALTEQVGITVILLDSDEAVVVGRHARLHGGRLARRARPVGSSCDRLCLNELDVRGLRSRDPRSFAGGETLLLHSLIENETARRRVLDLVDSGGA